MEQNENQDSIRERIRAYAFDLKLPLVRRDIDLLIQQGLDERWNLWMFTAELLRQEKENRSENQRRHRIKNAAFAQLRYLNEIDTDALPPEARKALPNLETLDFIKEGRNLILYGNPGTGKTHLATALGIAACNAGYSVLFTSVPRLLTQIKDLYLHGMTAYDASAKIKNTPVSDVEFHSGRMEVHIHTHKNEHNVCMACTYIRFATKRFYMYPQTFPTL